MSGHSTIETALLAAERRSATTGLPADLMVEAARRLRALALLYAFVFFMNDPLAALLFPAERQAFVGSVLRWLPATVSIGTALVISACTWTRRMSVKRVLDFGLLFQVVGSFGIAAAQFLDPSRYVEAPPWVGLSWVAIWMLGYTVVIPSPPRKALVAALASASSVPLTVALVMATGLVPVRLDLVRFLFLLVMPYVLVVIVAYVGAHIVYGLGTEVSRARELGSYRLIERLGYGGMGEVWRAQHRLLARPAAVKLMRLEVLAGSSPERQLEMRSRFEREAQATASLRSPHTIDLYDFGAADDGTFYYVMELLDGFNLEVLVQRFGPLLPERAVQLLLQVCDSLGEAHDAGLIHRDIKPANIFVCHHGREVDFVKVLDFGLVKTHSGEGRETAISVSRDLEIGGTPAFMSPEQITGMALDSRSDLYAVGCLAYWLVTGELVFSGRTVMETMVQHASHAPIPPSQRTELPIPPALDAIILACLAKSPADRPATADALAASLAAIPLPEAWTRDRAKEWWRVNAPTVH